MRQLFLLFCFLVGALYADDAIDMQESSLALQFEPSAFVNGVNAITGTYHHSRVDLTIPGQALDLQHFYSSDCFFDNWMGKVAMSTNFPTRVICGGMKEIRTKLLSAEGSQGSFLQYKSEPGSGAERKRLFYLHPKVIHRGLTNTGSGEISGRTNLKNSWFHFKGRGETDMPFEKAELKAGFGDGTRREYHNLHRGGETVANLRKEIRPSGNYLWFDYHHDESLKSIHLFDRDGKEAISWLKFDYDEEKRQAKVEASNGRSVEYSFMKRHTDGFGKMQYVKEIRSSFAPHLWFDYEEVKGRYLISKVISPEGRFVEIEYDNKGRVKAQNGPHGRLWKFVYHDYQTEVFDALGHKTLYHYSTKNRPTIIDHYAKEELIRRERFFWGERASLKEGSHDSSDEGNLIAKAVMTGTDKALSSQTLHYDSCGNVLHQTLYGNLTGTAHRTFSIDDKGRPTTSTEAYKTHATYSNDSYNLTLSTSADDGSKVSYQYKKESNLVLAKFTHGDGRIQIREFFDYDKNGTLIEHSVDDGDSHDCSNLHRVTQRKITKIVPVEKRGCLGVGLPAALTEYFYDLKKEKKIQLKRHEFFYNTEGLCTLERVYDSDDRFAYEIIHEYDSKGRLTRFVDAIGREQKYEYDANNNKTYEKLSGSGVAFHYKYDRLNRHVERWEEHSSGENITETYEYDAVGNRIAVTNGFGETTRYAYDDLNRLIKTTFPKVVDQSGKLHHPEEELSYDEADNVVRKKDANGHTTKTSYNARKQPVVIQHPDGSEERFEYNLNGTLKHKWLRNGSRVSFEYDFLQRVTQEKRYDSNGSYLSSTKKRYSAFHLVSEEDAMGYQTNYRYDGAGRLIEIIKEESRTTYEYDSLGRKSVSKAWSDKDFVATFQKYDQANRVIEERQECSKGTLISKMVYRYDIRDNRIEVKTYHSPSEATSTHAGYDSHNRLISSADEYGAVTAIDYDPNHHNRHGQKVLYKTVRDPLGTRFIEQYDTLDRLVYTCTKDPHQKTVQRAFFRYDRAGNKIREVHQAIQNHAIDHRFRIEMSYNAMHQLIELTEQPGAKEEKRTRYEYNKGGFLKKLMKPDGVSLSHHYDAFGNLLQLTSSDDTIHYEYSYDKNGNPISVYDKVNKITHKRSYNAHGQVTKDFDVELCYDALHRLKKLTLPDSSAVQYSYNKGTLSSVTRLDDHNQERYRHSYDKVDLRNHVLKSTLPFETGTLEFTWDKKGRCVAIQAPSYSESITSIDAADNLHNITTTDIKGTVDHAFDYDSLYQLVKENEHSYSYDSLSNRLTKDKTPCRHDHGNKLLSTSDADYTYDKNGNLTKQTHNGTTTHFRYDALNRLIEVKKDKETTHYVYDSLHRRLSKETSAGKEYYLYLAEREIAALDSHKAIKELRVLGRGKASDIGAAVALELEDGTYIPIHDHRGNIVTLLDSYGHVAESMRYTAFGEESASKRISPWRFASKRYDPETGFLYFGQRYYSPSTGRWITPDPSGFADGPNLYAYVLNNPMTLFDPYGLSWWDDARDWISHAADSFSQAARVHDEEHSERLDNCTREEDHAAMDAVCRSNLGKAAAVGSATGAIVVLAIALVPESVAAAGVYGAMVLKSGQVVQVSTTLTGSAAATATTTSNVALPIIESIGIATSAAGRYIFKSIQELKTSELPSTAQVLEQNTVDFVGDSMGTIIPKSRSVLESGFNKAGLEKFSTRSPGQGYVLNNGMHVRVMEPSGPAPLRASFTNSNGGAVSPYTNKPVHAPRNTTRQTRLKYIRENTHLELDP